MSIDYDHQRNTHTTTGAEAALPVMLRTVPASSLLDVGCGTGTWLRAVAAQGITDFLGVDGVALDDRQLLIPSSQYQCHDLTKPLHLGRQFDLVLCLEVAEHLDPATAPCLVETLVNHSNQVFFSAASPGQPGQHHVNCQWPAYWQGLFNARGYLCEDAIRWQLWDDSRVEPWYRQNLFLARKDSKNAGQEPRLSPVIHPEMLPHFEAARAEIASKQHQSNLEEGHLPATWYARLTLRAWRQKLRRRQ